MADLKSEHVSLDALAAVLTRHRPTPDGWPRRDCTCGAQLDLEGSPVPAGVPVGVWRHAQHVARFIEVEHIAGRLMSAKAEQHAEDYLRRYGDPKASGGMVNGVPTSIRDAEVER